MFSDQKFVLSTYVILRIAATVFVAVILQARFANAQSAHADPTKAAPDWHVKGWSPSDAPNTLESDPSGALVIRARSKTEYCPENEEMDVNGNCQWVAFDHRVQFYPPREAPQGPISDAVRGAIRTRVNASSGTASTGPYGGSQGSEHKPPDLKAPGYIYSHELCDKNDDCHARVGFTSSGVRITTDTRTVLRGAGKLIDRVTGEDAPRSDR